MRDVLKRFNKVVDESNARVAEDTVRRIASEEAIIEISNKLDALEKKNERSASESRLFNVVIVVIATLTLIATIAVPILLSVLGM